MKRFVAVIGGGAVGVAAMLAILQPWKMKPRPVKVEEGDSPVSVAELAWTRIQAGDLDDAQRLIAKAASLDPQLFEVALYQGHLDMVRDEHAAARRSYSEALKRRAGDARALAGRAAARFELREYAGAVEDATAALAADPGELEALFTRAAAFGALGRTEEAVRDWTSYLARRPNDAQAWTNRGNANERLGQKTAAIADWTQAVKLDPSLSDRLNPLISGTRSP